MTKNIKPSHVLDHAGQHYAWFEEVTENQDGTLTVVTGDPEITGLPVKQVTIDAAAMGEAVAKTLLATPEHNTYELRFFRDLLKGDFDEADGDGNAVDSILQMAVFGELIFS